ncbi:helicase-related protein [Polyangium spumosum]|uniref:Helicase n=1 Tax=Polyangium spumosum TaxID=889282 RepID=A0A6N7PY93_9BACT|nr:helicase-related protein [Polyangium spumosum]MRG96869.1 hypothetical protein [Polyangium spumosum]
MSKPITRIGFSEAKKLLDFHANGPIGEHLAAEQLRGAVALHNILATQDFAYLADEVGMGKTYVALGVLCLLRFAHPDLRVLVIAPKKNIQEKWLKEWRNLVATNYLATDLVVKSFGNTPARPAVACHSLPGWAEEVVKNPDRDVFLRLPSFSFGMAQEESAARESKKRMRDELVRLGPMLERAGLDLRSLQDNNAFKDAYARSINALLPHYDLVIIDEAHNLKHGYGDSGRVSARNRLLAMTLGSAPDGAHEAFPLWGKRFDRVLFLSATPLESHYEELHHQLALFGFETSGSALLGEDAEKRAKEFMIRRLTRLDVAGDTYTKNMYRREWRGGGVRTHDEALEVPDAQSRLVVALVQRKVAEVIRHPKFDKTFQMGMLASFESFGETARKKRRGSSGEDANFDGSEQAETDAEKEGADVGVIKGLRTSYYKHVAQRPMPHPKMDCVVDSLRTTFGDGQKALVFVRRIRSVQEIGEKLRDHYDAWIEQNLRRELPNMGYELGKVFERYRAWRQSRMLASHIEEEAPRVEGEEGGAPRSATDEESGEVDDPNDDVTFFSWFFRGTGPEKCFSGASFRNNQLQGDTSPFGTFFDENYVLLLLGAAASEDPLGALSRAVEQNRAALGERLRRIATSRVRGRRGEVPRRAIFEAYQAAALVVLAGARLSFKRWAEAEALLDLRFPGTKREPERTERSSFPGPDEYLKIRTFFSGVQERPALARVFFPTRFERPAQFALDRELRRELLSCTARLGHAFITLWALAADLFGSLEARRAERSHDVVSKLLNKYCDRLESEICRGGLTAMYELSSVSQNFDEIVRLNFPEAKRAKYTDSIRKELRKELSAQRPVAGMFGGVTPRIVKQFRMPGYPLVLVSTDVVKEGEDLHTFCSKVIHYGIAWNPSEMEQRTGRIDRIGSATHRRLGALDRPVRVDEKLEAQYPYLGETVERLQMARLFRKMNRFVRAMHQSFGGEDLGTRSRESSVHVDQAFARDERDTAPIEGRLETKFEIDPKLLRGTQKINPAEKEERAEACVAHFSELVKSLGKRIRIDWHDEKREAGVGTTYRRGPRLLRPQEKDPWGENGVRQQPFLLYVEGAPIEGRALVHLTSPVGCIREDEPALAKLLEYQETFLGARICLVSEGEGLRSYTVTVEGDVLLDPETTDVEELCDLFAAVALCADDVEHVLLSDEDREYETFKEDLKKERATAHDG